MGGQDWLDAQRGKARGHPGALGTAAPQRTDRLADALRQHGRWAGPLAPAQQPQAVLLLGEVDDLEVQGKSVGEKFPGGRIQRVESLGDAASRYWVAVTPEGDEVAPRLFHEREERRTALFGDDLTEERPQQADLASEGILRPGTADAAGFPSDSRVRPGPCACYCGWARTMIRISVMSSMA
jgi:hypothetical protein